MQQDVAELIADHPGCSRRVITTVLAVATAMGHQTRAAAMQRRARQGHSLCDACHAVHQHSGIGSLHPICSTRKHIHLHPSKGVKQLLSQSSVLRDADQTQRKAGVIGSVWVRSRGCPAASAVFVDPPRNSKQDLKSAGTLVGTK